VTSGVHVRRIAPGEGALLRDVRLRALADAPLAFGSTHAREVARPQERWDAWAGDAGRPGASQVLFLAMPGPGAGGRGAPIGLSSGVVADDDATVAHLYSMWVAPEARGTGAGAGLVAAIVEWARERSVRTLLTSVTIGNDPVARLYARAGFEDTGRREPLGHSGAEAVVLQLAL
jgi:GNAT superfamily N-acetyltransferase